MTRAKLSPSPVKILTSQRPCEKSGKSAPGTSSSATKIPPRPRPPPPRARIRTILRRWSARTTEAQLPKYLEHFSTISARAPPCLRLPGSHRFPSPPGKRNRDPRRNHVRSSSHPATSQAPTLRPPSSLTRLRPAHRFRPSRPSLRNCRLGMSCRTQEPSCIRICQCGWLSGLVAVRGRSTFTHPPRSNSIREYFAR